MANRFKCRSCTRHNKCRGPFLPLVHGDPEILVLCDAPSSYDEGQGMAFSGTEGQEMLSAVGSLGVGFVATYAVGCYSNGTPSLKQLEKCRPHWLRLVKKYKPRVIVALGAPSCKTVCERKMKLSGMAGHAFMAEIDGSPLPVVANYSPAFVSRQLDERGGEAEKVLDQWASGWVTVDRVLREGIEEPPDVETLTEGRDIVDYLDSLPDDEAISYDYETWGDRGALRPALCKDFKVLTVGVCVGDQAVAFPLDYDKAVTRGWKLKIEQAWRRVLDRCMCVAHNSKYEHKCNTIRFGETWPCACTMLRANVLNERDRVGLDFVGRAIGLSWCGYKLQSKDTQENPAETDLGGLLTYNARDALVGSLAYAVLTEKLEEEGLIDVAELQEQYAENLAAMEMDGMQSDPDVAEQVHKLTVAEIDRLTEQMLCDPSVRKVERWAANNIGAWKATSRFNPNSHPQMMRLCLKVLKLPIKPDKKKKTYKLDKKSLAPFVEQHDVLRLLNGIRSAKSMLTGFLDKWGENTDDRGRVHTNYNQTVVVTGRLSSTDPSLQNIPREGDIRKCFVSRFPGGWVLSADFSQLEPRLVAGMSGDEGMIRAFREGLDLHLYVGAELFEANYLETLALLKTKDPAAKKIRIIGKAMNLGTIYGQTAHGLSGQTGISLDEADEFICRYDDKFSGVRDFRERWHQHAFETGYVHDLFGRRRHLPDAQSESDYRRERAFRQAGNAPVQSTGNQFCLISVCVGRQLIEERGLEMVLSATVHDSLVAECSSAHKDDAIQLLNDATLCHNDADYWKDSGVPMGVEIKAGRDLFDADVVWDSLHPTSEGM